MPRLVLVGRLAVWRLPDPPPHPPVEHPSFWRSIADGIAEAARSEQIWPVLLLNFGIGVFYVGPFMAVLPLVVRDNYARRRGRDRLRQPRLLGRHHRGRLRLRRAGARLTLRGPPGRCAPFRSAR